MDHTPPYPHRAGSPAEKISILVIKGELATNKWKNPEEPILKVWRSSWHSSCCLWEWEYVSQGPYLPSPLCPDVPGINPAPFC